jgi:stage II sporulation protein D
VYRLSSAVLVSAAALQFAPGAGAGALFVVKGGGWGNGVGMSQWGAEGAARHGWDYRRILTHYYPGTSISSVGDEPVRVLVAEKRPRFAVGSSAPFVIVDGRGQKLHLRPRTYRFGSALRLRSGRLVTPLTIEPGAQPLVLDGRAYRGSFTIVREARLFDVVNEVPVELYLRSVVGSELPGAWHEGAYEAQAVAARSFALAERNEAAAFDLYPDGRSQVYAGISAENPAADAAVVATAGQVLTYRSTVIAAYYDSSSGGRTAAVEDVFPGVGPRPYLVSVRDPYDAISPYHRWQSILDGAALAGRLHQPVDDVRVEHNPSGLASRVLLIGPRRQKTVLPDDFARELGLRSTRFSVSVAALTPPRANVRAGEPLHLRGFLRDIGGVILEQRIGRGWHRIARVHAAPDGRFTITVTPRKPTAYRLAVAGAAGSPVDVTPRK